MICEKDECTGFCSLLSKFYASAVCRKHEQVYIISCMSEFSSSTIDNQAAQTTLETENLIRTLPRSLAQSGICEKANAFGFIGLLSHFHATAVCIDVMCVFVYASNLNTREHNGRL